MKMISIKPYICMYDNIDGFISEYHVRKGDLILTHEFLYETFIKKFNLDCDFIIQEKYGDNKSSEHIADSILKNIEGKEYKRIIAIGEGTIINIAKLLVIKDLKNVIDLFNKKIPLIRNKELIAIPTTCEIGSEVTNLSIIELKDKKTKIELAAEELYADHAILIPEFVGSLTYKHFIFGSIDALIHAIESYLSPKSNCYTELFSIKAIEMILKGFMKIIQYGENYRFEIIEDFLIASNYTGVALDNTGAGWVHALSYPIEAIFCITHGEANYQFFTEVLKMYSGLKPDGKIKELGTYINSFLNTPPGMPFYRALENMLNKLIIKKKLCGDAFKEKELALYMDSIIENQQGLQVNNYIPFTRENIKSIYETLLKRYNWPKDLMAATSH